MRKPRTDSLKYKILTTLETTLRNNKYQLNINRTQIKKLAEEQNKLKKEVSDLHAIIWEYKK